MNDKENIDAVVNQIKKIGGEKIKFVILYGSFAEGRQTLLSDVDIAVYYEGSKEERFAFRKQILGRISDTFDVQTFQDLPVYIRKQVISQGKLLYRRNYAETFDVFMRTIKEFRDFKPCLDIYYSGLEA